jgi:hypothetical protein
MTAGLFRALRRALSLGIKLVMTCLFMAYLLVARSFLYILTLYVAVYFISGHSTTKHFVQQALSSELPGFVTVGTMQWGPMPWSITLAGSRVHGEHTQEVLHVEMFEAEIDWVGTAAAVTRMMVVPDAPIPVLMRHVRFVRPTLHMTKGSEGLDFVRAFHIPSGEPSNPPKKTIRINHATIEGARIRIDFPEIRIDAEGVDLHFAHLLLENIDDVNFLVSRAQIATLDFHMRPHFRPFPSLDRLTIPIRNLAITRFQFVLNRFEALKIQGELDGGTMTASIAMDFVRGQTPLWKTRMKLDLPETSTLLPELFDGHARGALAVDIAGHGSLDELNLAISGRSPTMNLLGHDVAGLTMALTMAPEITPEGRINHPFVLQTLSGDTLGGRLEVGPFRYVMRWAEPAAPNAQGLAMPGYGSRHAFGGTLKLEGIDPWELLGSLDLDLASLPVLKGSAMGTLHVNGHIDEETGRLVFDASTDRLRFSWQRASGWPLNKVFDLSGGVGLSMGGPGASAPVDEVFGSHSLLSFYEMRLKSGSDTLVLDAELDLERGVVDAYADVRIRELRRFLAPLGVDGVAGRAHLARVRVTDTFMNPTIETYATIAGADLAGNPMGTLTSYVALRDGLLKVTGMKTVASWGTASADGQIQLWNEAITSPDPALPFVIKDARVDNLQLKNLLPQIGLSARVSVKADRISGKAVRLIDTVEGSGTVRATDLRMGPDSAKMFTAELVANSRMLKAKEVAITLASGDEITGSVMMTKGGRQFSAHLKTDELPLTAIKWFGVQGVNLGGRVSADLSLDGSFDKPVLIGTLSTYDFSLDPLFLGDGSFSITTAQDGRIELSALENFPGMSLLEGSHLVINRGIPTYANFRVQAEDAKVYEVLPFLAIDDTELTTSAMIEVDLWPGRNEDAWRVLVDAMPGDVRLSLFDGELEYDNLSELFVVLKASELVIEPVALGVDLDDAILLCGTFQEESLWDLQVGGRLNMRLLSFLKDMFSVMEGHIVVAPDRSTARALGEAACLPRALGSTEVEPRVLRLQGDLLSPNVSGKLAMSNILLTPRNFGRDIELSDGSTVILRPGDEEGTQRVSLGKNKSSRVKGTVEDGQFEIWGDLMLKHLALDSADIRLVGTEIFYASPGEYNITVNPELTLVVSDFMDDERRKLSLSGNTQITEGMYYRSFDSLGQAIGNIAGGSEGKTHELPLVERVPWLKSLFMDLNVFGSTFEVTSPYTGGSAAVDTRFDLRVTGTLEEMAIYDRLQIIPGGIVTYDLIGREFEVIQGMVDFRGDLGAPEIDLELATDVAYEITTGVEDQVEEREVTVSVRISGVPPNLDIEFWSKDSTGLDQADLQSLILTGSPRTESASLQDSLGISFDFSQFLSSVLKAPFFEAFKARVGPQGTVTTQIVTEFGRAVQLHTKVTQAATETRVRAGFQFQLSDNLSLEGTLQRTDRAQNPTQTYEARFKYRIPID